MTQEESTTLKAQTSTESASSLEIKIQTMTPDERKAEYKRISAIKSRERTKDEQEAYLILHLEAMDEKRAKIARQKAKAEKRLENFRNPPANKKQEDRKKMLIGAAFYNLFNKDENKKKEILTVLDSFLVREGERALFDLKPKN